MELGTRGHVLGMTSGSSVLGVSPPGLTPPGLEDSWVTDVQSLLDSRPRSWSPSLPLEGHAPVPRGCWLPGAGSCRPSRRWKPSSRWWRPAAPPRTASPRRWVSGPQEGGTAWAQGWPCLTPPYVWPQVGRLSPGKHPGRGHQEALSPSSPQLPEGGSPQESDFEDVVTRRQSDWLRPPQSSWDEGEMPPCWDPEPPFWQDVLTTQLWQIFVDVQEKAAQPCHRGECPGGGWPVSRASRARSHLSVFPFRCHSDRAGSGPGE